MIFQLYNYNGLWALVGYIEINGYKIYINNPILLCDICSIGSKQRPETDSYNKIYYGYKGQSDTILYFKFTFQIPINESELKKKQIIIKDYNKKIFHFI